MSLMECAEELPAGGWVGAPELPGLFFFFNLVLLEGDLSYFAIPHEGSCYPVHTFSSPDPNDEVWREKSDFLPYFPLEKMVGRISLLNSAHVPPYPQSFLLPATTPHWSHQ